MISVKTIDVLPVPVSILARNFFESDADMKEVIHRPIIFLKKNKKRNKKLSTQTTHKNE